MEKITLNISRDKSYVGAAVPYRIFINGQEVTRLFVGKSFTTEIVNEPTVLKISMVGNALSIHKIEKEVTLLPNYCKTNVIDCHIRTKAKWLGILTSGLLQAPGEAEIDVEYN